MLFHICRDIAIWYDEYLVPGENFNQAIQKAMQKSDLFALTVTPNLLENPNYVMQHEFPDARDAGMKILPVEMRETNQEQLKADYSGLPECVRPDDTETLSEKLLQIFSDISEINHTPEHEFFIGLAYLGGVDVEINHERAVKLITYAAEKEFPEAVEKLVSMYRNGEGVKRNYETAISWQKKLVDIRKKQFEQEQSDEVGFDYAVSLLNLGDFIKEIGHMAEAETVYRNMLSACEQFDKIFDNYEIKRRIGISYNQLGEVCQTQYDITGAKEFYEKCLAIVERLAQQTDSVELQKELAESYDNLGDLCKAQDDLMYDAMYFYMKSLIIKKRLAEQTDSVKLQRDLAESYDNLGDVCYTQKYIAGAKIFYEKCLSVRQKIVNRTKAPEDYAELAISLCTLSLCAEPKARMKYLLRAKAIFQKLVKQYPYNGTYAKWLKTVKAELKK